MLGVGLCLVERLVDWKRCREAVIGSYEVLGLNVYAIGF